jgi:hypothetical protein
VKRVEYIEDENGCWIWQKQTIGKGYGRKWVDGRGVLAHRWYYEQANEPIPEGLQIDHLCRVKRCVNPAHLEVVTNTENRRRRSVVTAEQVRDVRRRGLRCAAIARELGISETAASWIARRMTWQGVE